MPPREKPARAPILCEHRIPDTSFCPRCDADKKARTAKKEKRAGKA